MPAIRYRALVLSAVKHDYIPHAVAAHPRCDLVAVADEEPCPSWVHERNQKLADTYHIPYIRDPAAALAKHKPDIAVISSEAERHVALALQAVEAGAHVIVDKPLSPSLAACDRLVAALNERELKSLVWNRNAVPAIRQALDTVRRGELGKLRALHADFYFAKDADPRKGSRGPNDPPIDWLTHQIAAHEEGADGGIGKKAMGELQVEGIYPLAYFHALTGGASVERVFARTSSHFHQAHADNEVDDLATVSLEFEDGLLGSLCIGRIGRASHPNLGEIKLHLIGSQGALVVNEPRPEMALYHCNQHPNTFTHHRLADESNFLLVDDFLQAIEEGRRSILDAKAARDIAAVIDAALASSRQHAIIAVCREK